MSDAGERTIAPTPRRREEARRRGLLPAAHGPAWIASAVVVTACLPSWTRHTTAAAVEAVRGGLAGQSRHDPATGLPAAGLTDHFAAATASTLWTMAMPTLAVLAAAVAAAVLTRAVLDGIAWRSERLAMRFDRLDPVAGIARAVGPAAAGRAVGGLLGLAAITGVAAWSFGGLAAALGRPLAAAADFPLDGELAWAAYRGLWGLLAGAAGVVLARHLLAGQFARRRLRMTVQEFRDEQKGLQAATPIRLRREDAAQRRSSAPAGSNR
jgi:flagellar biosynthesis protein FlhB